MRVFPWLALGLASLSIAFSVQSAAAQKLDATVLYRQDSDISYHAVIPGFSGPAADITGACTLDPDPANCPDPGQNGSTPGEISYTLVGTTLSLLLPDGKVALVNCVNRFSAKGNYVNRRSCGMPLVEHVEAEFTGQTAKLKWPVGTDGKIQSETYRVVALLDKKTDKGTQTARASVPVNPASH